LAHLRGMKCLRLLNVSNTRVSDAGLGHLKGLRGLKTLNVRGTRVTGAGVRALRQARPGLIVVQ
jgi:hypothetical protein